MKSGLEVLGVEVEVGNERQRSPKFWRSTVVSHKGLGCLNEVATEFSYLDLQSGKGHSHTGRKSRTTPVLNSSILPSLSESSYRLRCPPGCTLPLDHHGPLCSVVLMNLGRIFWASLRTYPPREYIHRRLARNLCILHLLAMIFRPAPSRLR